MITTVVLLWSYSFTMIVPLVSDVTDHFLISDVNRVGILYVLRVKDNEGEE